ncbi:MAG: alpha/beta hydrolase, partial [Bacteroidota bacterium]
IGKVAGGLGAVKLRANRCRGRLVIPLMKGANHDVVGFGKGAHFSVGRRRAEVDKLETLTMPVLFLQGKNDPGQHREEYENTPDFVKNGRVQFIDGNHFFQLGAPEAATAAMRDFLAEPLSE